MLSSTFYARIVHRGFLFPNIRNQIYISLRKLSIRFFAICGAILMAFGKIVCACLRRIYPISLAGCGARCVSKSDDYYAIV